MGRIFKMRQSILFVAAGFLALAACQREVLDPQTESKPEADLSNASTVEIIAGDAGTRTEITEVSSGSGSDFALSWSKGDQVDLLEMIYEYFPGGGAGEPDPYVIYASNPLSSATETATFSVSLGPRQVPDNPTYHYVGVYPTGHIYGATQSGNHAKLNLYFPDSQYPSATSFDPNADLLVSDIKNTSSRMSGTVHMSFARVGTIVKMTLKGLTPGAQITSGTFTTDPNDWASDYLVDYDPVTKDLGYTKSEGVLAFYPQDVYVNNDGEADIWLRTRSGTISSWFRVDITTTLDKVETRYSKEVNLQSANRTITLKNGGLTSFGVNMESRYNITFSNWDCWELTTTGFKFEQWCYFKDVPEAVYRNADFGIVLLTEDLESTPDMSDFPAESILPFESDRIYYYPGSDDYMFMRGIIYLTDLSSSTDYYVLPYLKLGSAVYFGDGTIHVKTLKGYTTPGLVDLGLPSGTLWGDANMGAPEPGVAGDYFMFGSTEPMDGHYSGYNEYWDTAWNGYRNVYKAKKYLTDERFKYYGDDYTYDVGMEYPVDMLVELEPDDDAAYVKLGEGWRTPTYYDFLELQENCTMTENTADGSVTWTSRINGNSITLPACGYYQGSGTLKTDASYYLTGSLCVEGIRAYNHDSLFRNQIWVFWKGFPGVSTSYNNSGYRNGYYNIRPVYSDEESVENRKYYMWSVWLMDPNLGPNSATLSAGFWGLDESVNWKYYIRYFDSAGSFVETVNLSTPVWDQDGVGEASVTINNLSPGTVYYYQAYATHPTNSILSQYSEILKFTTPSN